MTALNSASQFEAPYKLTSPIVEFWIETLAPKFVAYRHILEGGLSRHSAQVLPRLDIRSGERVLDVGCGFGDTTLSIARMVGGGGHATGVDCCADFLELAQRDLDASTLNNVTYRIADAERGLPGRQFDSVFSRFGTMFFINPVEGLRKMRAALRPGGMMTHIVWRSRSENPWLSVARSVLLEHLPQPNADAPSCGPGPFSMADPELVSAQMRHAGFIDFGFEKIDAKVLVGRNVEEAIAFQLALGPAGEIFRSAGAEAYKKQQSIEADLRDVFSNATCDKDGIWMESASWMITAKSPQEQ